MPLGWDRAAPRRPVRASWLFTLQGGSRWVVVAPCTVFQGIMFPFALGTKVVTGPQRHCGE